MCVLAVCLFTGAGFLGVSCVAALTKKFGALVSAITTTARKAVTLLLSFLIFPKPATPQHYLGGCLFLAGLMVRLHTCVIRSVRCTVICRRLPCGRQRELPLSQVVQMFFSSGRAYPSPVVAIWRSPEPIRDLVSLEEDQGGFFVISLTSKKMRESSR